MMSGTFLFVYLCCNAFRAYIISLFFKVFFSEEKTPKKVEILSYIAFFIINSAVYIFIKIPVLNLIVNIIGFYLLTLNYNGSIRKRLLAVFLVYLTMLCIEVAFVYLFSHVHIDVFHANSLEYVYIPISTTIAFYIVSILLNKISDLKNNIKIPVGYWIMLAGIPTASLYMLVLVQAKSINLFSIGLCASLVLFINFAVFYLYNKVIIDLHNQMEKELLKQENLFYNRQIEQMESALSTTRKIQHDFRNHWMAITSFAENDNNTDLIQYMKEIHPIALKTNQWISTGNKSIDSILNYKIQEASNRNISIYKDIKIPENLNIAASDCVIILGNLLDNAITAVEHLNKNRSIQLTLKYDRGLLLLNIENEFSGKINKEGNKILSTKNDYKLHGYGLENVKSTIEKYQGSMDINHENNIFSIAIVMYIN